MLELAWTNFLARDSMDDITFGRELPKAWLQEVCRKLVARGGENRERAKGGKRESGGRKWQMKDIPRKGGNTDRLAACPTGGGRAWGIRG